MTLTIEVNGKEKSLEIPEGTKEVRIKERCGILRFFLDGAQHPDDLRYRRPNNKEFARSIQEGVRLLEKDSGPKPEIALERSTLEEIVRRLETGE
jgi:hypothetical protein